MKIPKVAATAVLIASALTSLACAQSQPDDIGKRIRDAATLSGPPGSPGYSAALRQKIYEAGTALRNGSNEYDPNRTVPGKDKPYDSNNASAQKIDRDQRYSIWLESTADHPLASLNIGGCSAMNIRVIGGESVTDPRCLAEVSLIYSSPTQDFCSGVLAGDQHTVLTAAHCLCLGTIEYVVFGPKMGDVRNYQAAVARQKGHDGVKCPGNGVTQADSSASLAGRDIAVVNLAIDVPKEVAQAVQLPADGFAQQQFSSGNKNILVVGFGFTSSSADRPILLQDPKQKTLALSPILSPDCSGSNDGKPDAELYGCASGREILTVDPRPVGPCFGDSGGGGYMLVNQQGASQKRAALVGITSRSTGSGCGEGAIYTSFTSEILSWVKSAAAADH
ncbi:secreted trypsin-like serine protease [Bradyrhizobium sp. USDA 4341]